MDDAERRPGLEVRVLGLRAGNAKANRGLRCRKGPRSDEDDACADQSSEHVGEHGLLPLGGSAPRDSAAVRFRGSWLVALLCVFGVRGAWG
jgi:hypothetical protein